MTSNPTRGPWAVSKLATPDHTPEFGIYAEGSQRDLARTIGENSEANAKLIALAPVMFAALKRAGYFITGQDYLDGLAVIRAAIIQVEN